jgi:hypothetical protein
MHCYLKANTNGAFIELLRQCSMQPGAIVPLVSMRGTTVNSGKEHCRISFFTIKLKKYDAFGKLKAPKLTRLTKVNLRQSSK